MCFRTGRLGEEQPSDFSQSECYRPQRPVLLAALTRCSFMPTDLSVTPYF